MTTSDVKITAGAGTNIATWDITEDAETKKIQRIGLADSAGAEVFGAAADSAAASDAANTGFMSLVKRLLTRTSTLITNLGSPFQAGGSIGNTAFVANAGANLNTSALATEAGHIANVDAKLPASLGAKTGANSLSIVPASDGFKTTTNDGLQAIPSAQLTRPANTTPYSIGDLVDSTTTAGSVTGFVFANAVRNAGEAFRCERIRLRKSGTSLTNASFRVYLCRALPTFSVGDNGVLNTAGALAIDDIKYVVGWFDLVMDRSATSGARGVGVPNAGGAISLVPFSGTTLYCFVEALAGYTPLSGELWDATLEGQWS